jgi:tRNA A64-2'-O-ribosylphosphate transferase
MAALVPGFCDAFAALGIDFASLRRVLTKPLRPVWVTPDSVLPGEGGSGGDDDNEDDSEEEAGVVFKDFRPIICCTASRRTLDPEAADDDGGATRGYAYVQGAADDTENWAAGLTAPLFWAYRERLLDFATTRSDAELLALIADVVEAETKRARGGLSLSSLSPPSSSSSAPKEDDDDDGDRKRAGPGVFVTTLAALPRAPRDGECHVVLLDDGPATPQEEWAVSHSRIEVRLGRHKTANKNLRHALPEIMAFVARFLARLGRETHGAAAAVVFACASATDLSVGAALAALCWFESSDERGLRPPRDDASASSTPARMSKDVVNVRRAAVMMALPHANPSRATLQSVNSFLMDWRRR